MARIVTESRSATGLLYAYGLDCGCVISVDARQAMVFGSPRAFIDYVLGQADTHRCARSPEYQRTRPTFMGAPVVVDPTLRGQEVRVWDSGRDSALYRREILGTWLAEWSAPPVPVPRARLGFDPAQLEPLRTGAPAVVPPAQPKKEPEKKPEELKKDRFELIELD